MTKKVYLHLLAPLVKHFFNAFLLLYYTFGVICLPMGDFSTMAHLSEMYSHCKETEDPNLTVFDFVGEHLMNLDMIFEAHESEDDDDDKPHQVVTFESHTQTTPLTEKMFVFEFKNNTPFIPYYEKEAITFKNQFYFYTPNFSIFRPPIGLS
ncbi:hypothetical protein [Flavobacterium sp.]|uniref:hypothetical protein n=1 Tax=Flavobacterium sp. TaxID=239 RepID=UPI003C466778